MDEKEIRQLLASKFVKYVKSHGLGDVVVEDEYIKFSFKHGGRVVRFGIKGYTLIAELFFLTEELHVARKLEQYITDNNLPVYSTTNDDGIFFSFTSQKTISSDNPAIKGSHLNWMISKAREFVYLYSSATTEDNGEGGWLTSDGIVEYGIDPKSVIGLALLLWDICNYVGFMIECHALDNGEYTPREKFFQRIVAKAKYYKIGLENIDVCRNRYCSNVLFSNKNNIARIILEEMWGISNITYEKGSTESKTYSHSLMFTSYALVLKEVLLESRAEYFEILLAWCGFIREKDVSKNEEYVRLERKLIKILTIALDSALIRIDTKYSFRFPRILAKLLKKDEENSMSDVTIFNRIQNSNSLVSCLVKKLLNQDLHYYLGRFGKDGIDKREEVSYEECKSYVRMLTNSSNFKERFTRSLDASDSEKCTSSEEPSSCLNIEANDTSKHISGGQNILLYGAPGVGKSYAISSEYCSDEDMMIRVVFHPEYSYADFVGQIQPVLESGAVVYKFIPGPFTAALMLALQHPASSCYLVIEELNRGQAPAIFGEIFQLLDRREKTDGNRLAGESLYGVTSRQIAEYLFGDPMKKIRIPANLNIIATMNTSDQNVFTLDTAFQRRWNMRYIENDFTSVPHKDSPILGSDVTWMHFAKTINDVIVSSNSGVDVSEDKRLGRYFVRPQDLACVNEEHMENVDEAMQQRPVNMCFAEKVVKYLWDDAFRYSRADLFDLDNVNTLDEAIAKFNGSSGNDRFRIFNSTVYDELVRSESK